MFHLALVLQEQQAILLSIVKLFVKLNFQKKKIPAILLHAKLEQFVDDLEVQLFVSAFQVIQATLMKEDAIPSVLLALIVL